MKRKTTLKAIALSLVASLIFTACGQSTVAKQDGSSGAENKPAKSKQINDLVITKVASAEMETFNWLYSQSTKDLNFITNLVDGLLETDSKGKLLPAIAEKWGTEDNGKTWTFNLRNDVKWVDVNGNEKADCTAYDFLTSLEWILNFYKNDSVNTAIMFEMVEGAREYYEYTKTLSKEEAYELKAGEGTKFNEMVKIKALDDYTLEYGCVSGTPYFPTLALHTSLYPMSQAMIDEIGVDGVKAMDNNSMWYNGAYTMTSYIQGNEKIMTKNPKYWDKDCSRFETVTCKMVDGNDVTYQLYAAGECDYCQLTESVAKTIIDNPNHEFHDYIVPDVKGYHSYQVHFNFDKRFKDGTPDENWNKAAANKAFRQSLYYGVDFTDYYRRTNILDPYSCQNNSYTIEGACYMTDGRDYTDLVKEKIGLTGDSSNKMLRYDENKAMELKKQAIEELTAIGVTFPVKYEYYIKGGNQPALDGAKVFKNCMEKTLGSDYIEVEIKEYVSSQSKEVRKPQLASGYNSGWSIGYGDPMNSLGQEILTDGNAFYSQNLSMISKVKPNDYNKELLDTYKTYTDLVNKANEITDNFDARYEAFAEAEAYLLSNALVMPLNLGNGLALSRIDNTSKMCAMYGCQNHKMKNWETNSDGYTTAEAKAKAEELKNKK